LLPLASQRREALLQGVPPTPVLSQRDDTLQIRVGKTFPLLGESNLGLPQLLAAGLECLRQPLAALRPLQSLGNRVRMREDLAEIMPDQGIEAPGGDKARGALATAARLDRGHLPSADLVAIGR
jgi:hypothetical protein